MNRAPWFLQISQYIIVLGFYKNRQPRVFRQPPILTAMLVSNKHNHTQAGHGETGKTTQESTLGWQLCCSLLQIEDPCWLQRAVREQVGEAEQISCGAVNADFSKRQFIG